MEMYNNRVIGSKDDTTLGSILRIEEIYRYKFTNEFLVHYLTYNGGELERYSYKGKDRDYVFENFIPIIDSMKGDNLELTLKMLREDETIPNWFIPFGNAPGGDLYGYSIKEEDKGNIYYWSHEYAEEVTDEGCTYIAKTLTEFINSMVKYEE